MRKIHKFIRRVEETSLALSENLILVRKGSLAHPREIKATIYPTYDKRRQLRGR